MAKKTNSNKFNKTAELIFLFTSLIIILFLWDTIFVYPIKLFIVLVHELSHALVTIISGGNVKEVEIGFNLGGKIVSDGGNEIAIASAGYLGSLIWGLTLFFAAEKSKPGKLILFSLPILILLTLANCSPSNTFIILCFIVIITFILFGIFLHNKYISTFLKVIALSSSLYVLIDIKEDIFTDSITSDGIILSQLTGVNSILIGLIWMIISILLLGIVLKLIYFRKKN